MDTQDTINKIEQSLRIGQLNDNPHLCAEYVASMSGELSFFLSQQGEIAKDRAENWLEIRKNCKSDTQAEKEWSLTEKGIGYAWYEVRIRRIKALLVGLKTLIRMAESEQRNLQ